jgi:hypothetical protein
LWRKSPTQILCGFVLRKSSQLLMWKLSEARLKERRNNQTFRNKYYFRHNALIIIKISFKSTFMSLTWHWYKPIKVIVFCCFCLLRTLVPSDKFSHIWARWKGSVLLMPLSPEIGLWPAPNSEESLKTSSSGQFGYLSIRNYVLHPKDNIVRGR